MKIFALVIASCFLAGCAGAPAKLPVVAEPSSTNYKGLGAQSISDESLNKYTAKSLPGAVTERIQSYLDLKTPGMAVTTEDAKSLFFNWRITGNSQIWRHDFGKGLAQQLTGGENQTQIKAITPDGKFLVVARDRNGEENPGLYLQNLSGGPLLVIQNLPKVQTHFGGVSADSKFIYFTSNDIDPTSFAVYRYSVKGRTRELLYSKPGTWEILDISKDGRVLLSKELSNVWNEVYELEADLSLKPLFGQNDQSYFLAAFGPHPGQYFVVSPRHDNFKVLFSVHGEEWRRLSPNMDYNVDDLTIDAARTHLFYTVNANGHHRLHELDLNTSEEKKLDLPAGTQQERLQWISASGRWVALSLEFAKGPAHGFLGDLKNHQWIEWTNPSTPEIDPDTFVIAKDEKIKAKDGTLIPIIVRRPKKCPEPKAPNQCSVIVNFHGGPEGQALPTFNITAQIFTDAGFIYVEPNVRGSDGFGQDWLNSDNGPKRLKVIDDIEDVGLEIRKNWGAQKVGVMGGSYGGYSTLYAMTRFSGTYNAGVEIVGMSNLVTFLQNTAPYRRALRIAEYGDPEKDRTALEQLSPITFLENLKDPLLMIQGVNDPRVPVGEALQINQALEEKNVPHELILFPDEGHGAAKRSNQVIQLGKALTFFEKYLK